MHKYYIQSSQLNDLGTVFNPTFQMKKINQINWDIIPSKILMATPEGNMFLFCFQFPKGYYVLHT